MTSHTLDPALAALHAPARVSTEEMYDHDNTDLILSRPRSTKHDVKNGHEHAEPEQSLPPVDGGRHAWCFLASVFLFEAVIWGFPYSFGIFQEYYSSHPLFSDSSSVAAIGSTALGLMFIPAPLISLVLQRWPSLRIPCMVVGLAINVVSLVAASFCNTVPGLIGTQGAMFAIGGIVAYFPGMQFIDEWFVKRRATAFAVVWAGAPLAGIVIPFLMQWLLDAYGFRTALRVYAVATLVLLVPAMYFIKPRHPKPKTAVARTVDFTFLKHQCFWWYFVGTAMQSFGFFLPSLWIPTFATDMEFPSIAGPLALALYNIFAFLGTVAQGCLVDRYHVTVDLGITTVLSAVAIFIFWGFSTIQPMFYLFAILWGMSGGAYNATWAGFAFDLRAEGFDVDTTFTITLMVLAKGVASMTSGPLSETLHGLRLGGDAQFAYGGSYGVIIIYTGICSLLGGIACLRPRMRKSL